MKFLCREFGVLQEVYDKEVVNREETKKILCDPNLKGKSREEMNLKEFTRTEIHSSVMGIPIIISEEIIARAARCSNEGKFQWNLNNKTSSWIQTTYDAIYKIILLTSTKTCKKNTRFFIR